MDKIEEILSFKKLISKLITSFFDDFCDLLQKLTFYSEGEVVNKDFLIIYQNMNNLFLNTMDNYFDLYKNLDIIWTPSSKHGIIYFSNFRKCDKDYEIKDPILLNKRTNYNKIKVVRFQNNDYSKYLKSYNSNCFYAAVLYGSKDYVFKNLDELDTVEEALSIMHHNINVLTDINNSVKIEIKKLLKNKELIIEIETNYNKKKLCNSEKDKFCNLERDNNDKCCDLEGEKGQYIATLSDYDSDSDNCY